MNVNVGSTRRHLEPLLSTNQDLRTCNRQELRIPTYVVDGPRDEDQKDAGRAKVEPTDVQAKWQDDLPNFSNFACGIGVVSACAFAIKLLTRPFHR